MRHCFIMGKKSCDSMQILDAVKYDLEPMYVSSAFYRREESRSSEKTWHELNKNRWV